MAYHEFTVTGVPAVLSYEGCQSIARVEKQKTDLTWGSTGKMLGGPFKSIKILETGEYRVEIRRAGCCEEDPVFVLTEGELVTPALEPNLLDICYALPESGGEEITMDALAMKLRIDGLSPSLTDDTYGSVLTSFTYNGVTYDLKTDLLSFNDLEGSVVLKKSGVAFDGSYVQFILDFRETFFEKTGFTLPPLLEWGESTEITSFDLEYNGFNFPASGSPLGVAVDKSTGNILVANDTTNEIEIYSAVGALITSFSVDTECNTVQDVAVDKFTGNILVVDSSLNKVVTYTSAGVFISEFPTGLSSMVGLVVANSGNVLLLRSIGGIVYEFTKTGTNLGILFTAFETFNPQGIGEDNDGNLYVVDSIGANLYKYTSTGVYTGFSKDISVAIGENIPTGVSVDAAGDVLLVGIAQTKVFKYEDASINEYYLYAPETTGYTANLALLTDMTLYSFDPADGSPQGFSDDVVQGVSESTYETILTEGFTNGVSGFLSVCSDGCDEESRIITDLDGNPVDSAYKVIDCAQYNTPTYEIITDETVTFTAGEWNSLTFIVNGTGATIDIGDGPLELPSGGTITYNVDNLFDTDIVITADDVTTVYVAGIK